MSRILERGDKSNRLYFWCPGCECHHAVTTEPPHGWTFNGDFDKPTISPSVLCTFGNSSDRCHLFVRDGKLQFLNDCTHKHAGQTIDMVPLPGSENVES